MEILEETRKGLEKEECKEIPMTLLYNEDGYRLYEEITKSEGYYFFEAEKEFLETNAHEIASKIAPGTILVELGCGTAEKTPAIVNATVDMHGSCHYVGIDVSGLALQQAGYNLKVEGVEVELIQADNLQGLELVRSKHPDAMIAVVWLGGSIGNSTSRECVEFAKEMLAILGPRCQLLFCVDMWKEEGTLYSAYCDAEGLNEKFNKNGMKHGLSLFGYDSGSEESSWIYEVDINHKLRQVEIYIRFPHGLHIPGSTGIRIRKNERVRVAVSRKFNEDDIQEFARDAGFVIHAEWVSKICSCYMFNAMRA